MADFGLAAQIGRGGGGMGGGVQPADPTNQMLRIMQLQQLQQNMLLAREQAGREAQKFPMTLDALRADIETSRERTGLVRQQARAATAGADVAEDERKAARGILDYTANTPANLRTDPERLDALRRSNPGAYSVISDQIAKSRKLQEEAEAAGFTAAQKRFAFNRLQADAMLPLLDSVDSPKQWETVLRDYAAVNPQGAALISPEFNPRNVGKLRSQLQDVKELTYETDALGNEFLLNKRTGERRALGAPAAAAFGGLDGARAAAPASPQMVGQGAAALASPNAMLAPGETPIIQPRAIAPEAPAGLGPRATATFQETVAKRAGEAQGKERELSQQLDEAIREISAVAAPGGLISQSTGSSVGQAVDAAAAFIGFATPGARAGARLAPISDLALKLVPRFEGPQSDSDRKAYEKASGQLADTSVPVATRQDAAKELVRLMQKRRDQFSVRETPGAAPGTRQLTAQDQQALSWANSNPNDPRAALIKQRLGVQ